MAGHAPLVCPSCGYDHRVDALIKLGKWELLPEAAVYEGERIELRSAQARLIYAVAKSHPRPLSYDAALNRVSDSDNYNLIGVYLTMLREKLGWKMPIEVLRPHKLVWRA